ncbi:hypothetical protein AQUCO_05000008v1, partial [Aquilegia coerulea]
MDGVATPATEAAKYTAAFLGPQIGYVVYYKKNVKNLSSKIYDLSSMRNDIKGKISAATRRGELIYQAVERWLEKVDKILIEAGHMNDDASGIDSCFKGKTIINVTELVNEGRSINEVSTLAPIQDFDLMPTDVFEAFESTRSAMDLVMKSLVNDRISIIGVHGMGGIGKTILTRIGNQLKMNKLFEVVVMVKIAEDWCLNFRQERGETRKRRLFSRLKQEMRILIIMDDMWSRLDLIEVGIPCGEHHMDCKVVLTTRRLDVCNMMKTQVNVRLECLSEPDSWHLFQKNAGAEVDSSVVGEVARDVAKECKGLPVALVTFGR